MVYKAKGIKFLNKIFLFLIAQKINLLIKTIMIKRLGRQKEIRVFLNKIRNNNQLRQSDIRFNSKTIFTKPIILILRLSKQLLN